MSYLSHFLTKFQILSRFNIITFAISTIIQLLYYYQPEELKRITKIIFDFTGITTLINVFFPQKKNSGNIVNKNKKNINKNMVTETELFEDSTITDTLNDDHIDIQSFRSKISKSVSKEHKNNLL